MHQSKFHLVWLLAFSTLACVASVDADVDRPLLNAFACPTPPMIDGIVNEDLWAQCQWVSNFSLNHKAQVASQQTRVAFCYDEDNLYVAYLALQSRATMPQVSSMVTERDGPVFRDNSVELFVAPLPDQLPLYQLVTNTLATRYDAAYYEGGGRTLDWDPDWTPRVHLFEDMFHVEMAIPWSQLGIEPQAGTTLAISLARNEGPHAEFSNWLALIHDNRRTLNRFAILRLAPADTTLPITIIDTDALQENPPVFSPIVTNVPTDAQVSANVCIYTADDYPAAEAISCRTFDVQSESYAVITQEPLPDGPYIANINWMLNNNSVLVQEVPFTAAEQDNAPLSVELVQPFYSVEPFLRAQVTLNYPEIVCCDWQIIAEDGGVLLQGMISEALGTHELSIPISNLPIGQYDLVITVQNTSPEDSITVNFEKGAPLGVPTRFTIAPDGTWRKNDNLFVPMTMFLPRDMQELSDFGFNTVLTGHDRPAAPDCIETNLRILDTAQENGMYVWIHLCRLFRHQQDYQGLRLLVSQLKTHPALAGWHIADEPEGTSTAPATLIKAREIIHQIDPDHPVLGVSTTPALFQAYMPAFDVFQPDPYPVPQNDIAMVTDWLRFSASVMQPGQSLLVTMQAQGEPFFPRHPNQDEIWNMAYQSIVAGSKGLGWWAHGPARQNPDWLTYRDLVPHTHALLTDCATAQRINFEQDQVYAAVFRNPEGDIMVAVNTAREPREVTFDILAETITPYDSNFGNITTRIESQNITLNCPPLGFGAWRLNR
ncbi:MAG: hypothetical protein JW936_05650 [Sedimentisphaerales bacterium]|nr:hypothetical protein [Sedimentisphaerales bacterium]